MIIKNVKRQLITKNRKFAAKIERTKDLQKPNQ